MIDTFKFSPTVPSDWLLFFGYRKYSGVNTRTLGLAGSKDQIAVIRASGSISRTRGPFSMRGSGVVAEEIIEKIRKARGTLSYMSVTQFFLPSILQKKHTRR